MKKIIFFIFSILLTPLIAQANIGPPPEYYSHGFIGFVILVTFINIVLQTLIALIISLLVKVKERLIFVLSVMFAVSISTPLAFFVWRVPLYYDNGFSYFITVILTIIFVESVIIYLFNKLNFSLRKLILFTIVILVLSLLSLYLSTPLHEFLIEHTYCRDTVRCFILNVLNY